MSEADREYQKQADTEVEKEREIERCFVVGVGACIYWKIKNIEKEIEIQRGIGTKSLNE